MLTKEALADFKEIWRKEFNEEISDEVATNEAINLLTMFNAVYKPLKEEIEKKSN